MITKNKKHLKLNKMISTKAILSIGFCIGLLTNVTAQQDKHFSMFATSKVQSNPAAAGFFHGDYQFFTNFRNQWAGVSDQAFNTISASFDTRFETGNGFIGTGINFYNDVAGDSKYTVTQITIPINYAIELSRTNRIAIGLAPSYYQRSFKNTAVSWDNQWTGIAFNTGLNNGENIAAQNLSVGKFDLNAGLFWQGSFSKTSWLGIGVSGQHLTKQKINYFTDVNGLYRKLILSAYGNFNQQGSDFTLRPNFTSFIQGPNRMFVLGSGFDYKIKGDSRHTAYNKRTSIELGLYTRVGDAIIINTLFHMAGLTVGASFDFNAFSLGQNTQGIGAMEFLLAYKLSNPRGLGAPSIH